MKAKTASPETAVLTAERKLHNTWVYIKRHWQLYLLFLLPAVALTLVFKYAPMGGVLIAFQKYNPFRGIWGSEWVGFKNFTRFMSSPDFQRYLINTLKLSVYGLLWGFPIPILLAFLLNRIESKKIKQKVQLVLYMPNFISVIVLCGIVRVLLSVTGPVNGLLHTSINFMTLPEAFRPIYIISGIWQGAGWASIMYTASLSNASKDLKEAAMIDGAKLIQQIDEENHVEPMQVVLSENQIKAMSIRGVTLHLPQNDIDRLFIPEKYVLRDLDAGQCTVLLYPKHQYSYVPIGDSKKRLNIQGDRLSEFLGSSINPMHNHTE